MEETTGRCYDPTSGNRASRKRDDWKRYVTRRSYPTILPKVEYTLTALGTSLLSRLEPLVEWADQDHGRVRRARDRFAKPAAAAAL